MDPSPIRAANFCPRGLRVTTFGKKLQKTKGHPDVPPVVKGLFTPKKIAKRFFLASTVRPFGADHRSPSKVCLRQKKSRSDFFWRRPCGRSAQTTGRREAELAGTANAELAGTANAELAGTASGRSAKQIHTQELLSKNF